MPADAGSPSLFSTDDRLIQLETELAFYKEEFDQLHLLVHALGERSLEESVSLSKL